VKQQKAKQCFAEYGETVSYQERGGMRESAFGGDRAGRDVEMIVKVTGVSPEAISELHKRVKDKRLKPKVRHEEGVVNQVLDNDNGVVRILKCKMDEIYGTYTVELAIRLRWLIRLGSSSSSGIPRTIGEYYTPMSVFNDLMLAMSYGPRFLPESEVFVTNEKA
jgi:hypothetical protein